MGEQRLIRANGPIAPAVSDDLRRANAAAIARAILVRGPLARSELATLLNLTRATVSRVADQLLAGRLVRQGPARSGAAGRPLVPLEFDGGGRVVLSVHLGAVEVRVGAVTVGGQMVEEVRYRYGDTSPESVRTLIAEGLVRVRSALDADAQVLGLGAGIGGWVDTEQDVIVHYSPLGWSNVPWASVLPDIDLPRRADQLMRGLALAESLFGAARATGDFVELWSGNIVGAATVAEGAVRHGLKGAAGDISHFPTGVRGVACVCGRDDCLGVVATDDAIREAAIERGILRPGGSLNTLIGVVSDGDAAAKELLVERAKAFGHVGGLIAEFSSPELIVLAGLITTAPGYQQAFEEAFRASDGTTSLTRVCTSQFGDSAPSVASASALIDAYLRDPLGFSTTVLR